MFGTFASGLAAISLAFPLGFLETIWRVNPRGYEGLASLSRWGPPLMALVCALCAFTAYGLWRGLPAGRVLAIAMLATNAVGDVASGDPKTLIGLPIAAAMIFYLTTRRVRDSFRRRL